MIENCVPTLFSKSPDKRRSRDGIFPEAAMGCINMVSASDGLLILAQERLWQRISSQTGINGCVMGSEKNETRLMDKSRRFGRARPEPAVSKVEGDAPMRCRDIQVMMSRRSL